MLATRNSNIVTKVLLFTTIFLMMCVPLHAQKKKKKKYKKKKSDANIIARGYNDVTTRNNYYFNASNIYKTMLNDIEQKTEIDYDEILPLYMHQRQESFETYTADLESIIKKTSEAMLLHDNTRWKDNVYLLLGKARFMQEDYRNALNTFQFVVTTMKEDVGKTQSKVDNKARYKAAKAKEAAKKAAERKKELAKKKEAIKKQLQKLKRDKNKELASSSKNKKKQLDKKIKAKKKVIALRKKGKTPSQKLLAIANAKIGSTKDDEKATQNTAAKEENDKPKTDSLGNIIKYKNDYRSDKKIKKQEEAELAAELEELGEISDTVPLTDKEIKNYGDLNFWEKLEHKKSRPEALVWMAKSFVELGEYGNAQSMLEYAEALPKLTRKQREQIYAGEVYYYIERNRYENAIDALNNTIIFSRKKNRSKYSFIKAQIQEIIEDEEKAIETYRAVAKGKTDYEMKFYANMKVAKIYQNNDIGSNEEVIQMLTKLLKNGSNKEFRDQIHYSIASIYSNQNNLDKTKEHLQSSITASRENVLQKGLSFKALADVYLTEEVYDAAALFYDSAVAVIPTDYEEFDAIKRKSEAVTEAAKYAKIIYEQDSLLMMSKMTAAELDVFLAELQRNQRIESRGRKKKKSVTGFIENSVIVSTTNTLSNSGDWYFYNPSLLAKGKTSFQKTWGDIKHEDDWRRSSKQGILDGEEGINLLEDISQVDKKTEEKEVVEELEIPKTEAEIAEAHNQLSNAYYEFGKILRNQLEINGEAKQAFEAIVNKYPEFKSIDRVYYYLYLIYSDEGDIARAEHYKSILLENNPNSQYAVAMNTEYKFKRNNDNDRTRPEPIGAEKLYVSTYDSFLEGSYVEVINSRNEAFDRYKENPLMPKFDFLAALSYGHLDSLVVLKSMLSAIIIDYPNHEVEAKAREYLAVITKKENEENVPRDTLIVETDTGSIKLESIYLNEESNNLFAFIIIKDKTADIRTMIQILNQYNDNNFAARKLRVSNAFLDKNTPLMLVKRFREKSLAIEYLNALQSSMEEVFGQEGSKNLELLMISQDNFRILFTTKKMDEYRIFFKSTFN